MKLMEICTNFSAYKEYFAFGSSSWYGSIDCTYEDWAFLIGISKYCVIEIFEYF